MKFKNMLYPLIVCPAWIPELNSVEHGPEGKGPQKGWVACQWCVMDSGWHGARRPLLELALYEGWG